jgi:hypothetical protein
LPDYGQQILNTLADALEDPAIGPSRNQTPSSEAVPRINRAMELGKFVPRGNSHAGNPTIIDDAPARTALQLASIQSA